VTVYTEVV
jgi:hypothetical protein